jgi:hypothetical protein
MERHKKGKAIVRSEFIDQRNVAGQGRMHNKRSWFMFGISVAYVF